MGRAHGLSMERGGLRATLRVSVMGVDLLESLEGAGGAATTRSGVAITGARKSRALSSERQKVIRVLVSTIPGIGWTF